MKKATTMRVQKTLRRGTTIAHEDIQITYSGGNHDPEERPPIFSIFGPVTRFKNSFPTNAVITIPTTPITMAIPANFNSREAEAVLSLRAKYLANQRIAALSKAVVMKRAIL